VTYRSVGTRNIYRVYAEAVPRCRPISSLLGSKALADLKVVAEESFLKAKETNKHAGEKHEK
jgi:hypothetical protein